jgi:hypothetical protein
MTISAELPSARNASIKDISRCLLAVLRPAKALKAEFVVLKFLRIRRQVDKCVAGQKDAEMVILELMKTHTSDQMVLESVACVSEMLGDKRENCDNLQGCLRD